MSASCRSEPRDERRSTDGSSVELLPLEHGDRAAVLEVFAGLGARSRELRFLTPKPRLTEAEARHLTAVDQRDHVAILAVSRQHGRPIGVARFIREAGHPDSADVAVSVVDAWQGRGVGSRLADALVRRAREVGVRRFTMVMQSDNEAAVRLLHRGWTEVTQLAIDGDTAEFSIDLGE